MRCLGTEHHGGPSPEVLQVPIDGSDLLSRSTCAQVDLESIRPAQCEPVSLFFLHRLRSLTREVFTIARERASVGYSSLLASISLEWPVPGTECCPLPPTVAR